jgi:hypothetical protein
VDRDPVKLLLHGLDTVQCCYFLAPRSGGEIDTVQLAAERERLRLGGPEAYSPVTLGNRQFLLASHGSRSGYPFILSDADYRIEFGPHNNPPFFVTFRSLALWRDSVEQMHQGFLDWAQSVGYGQVKAESLTRVDYCFDYDLPVVDFIEDDFVTLSSKDAQHREDGQIQTFTFGKGDVVLRVYDKVVEIAQQSGKVWLYELWGQKESVWRIEWQVRKEVLRRFGIRALADLKAGLKPLLQYLAIRHDTLRMRVGDSNRARRPLHRLWVDLQRQIDALVDLPVAPAFDPTVVLEYRLMQIGISVYGYLKRVGAIRCVQADTDSIAVEDALQLLEKLIRRAHDRLTWEADIEKRITAMRLGEW